MGALESPDAPNGTLAMDTDNHGKAAKKQKSRGGKLAARLSPEEVRWCSCRSACDVHQAQAPLMRMSAHHFCAKLTGRSSIQLCLHAHR